MSTKRPVWRALVLATILVAPASVAHGVTPSVPPSPGCRDLVPGEYPIEVAVDGLTREVLIHVPPAASRPGARLPLVIAYHGHSAYASQLAESARLGPIADADGLVVAYPQGLKDGPWPPDWFFPGGPDEPPAGVDEIRFAEVLLEFALSQGCIDADRVIVVGHSKGGGMAEAIGCALADRIAGLVLVSAVQFGIPCAPVRPNPIVALHALDDAVLPYAGGHIPGTPPGYPDVLPVEQGMAAWATRNACTSGPVVTGRPDGGAVLAWEGCAAPVVLHRLATGGHDIPDLAAAVVREMALFDARGRRTADALSTSCHRCTVGMGVKGPAPGPPCKSACGRLGRDEDPTNPVMDARDAWLASRGFCRASPACMAGGKRPQVAWNGRRHGGSRVPALAPAALDSEHDRRARLPPHQDHLRNAPQ